MGTASHQIGTTLADELKALQNFLHILQREEAALIEGALETLSPIAKQKSNLAAQLNQFVEKRHALLSSTALPPNRVGMEQWLNTQTNKALQKQWQNLLELTTQAQQLNMSNGALIHTRMQHNQQALNALLEANQQASLYGPNGQTQSSAANTGRRLFGAA